MGGALSPFARSMLIILYGLLAHVHVAKHEMHASIGEHAWACDSLIIIVILQVHTK